MTDSPLALTVLLPVRNETMNLRVMLRILRAVLVIPHEILVIFDHEEDSSAVVVEDVRSGYPEVRALLNSAGRGVAFAIRAGVERAASAS
jgi:Glycosyl transferase family 2